MAKKTKREVFTERYPNSVMSSDWANEWFCPRHIDNKEVTKNDCVDEDCCTSCKINYWGSDNNEFDIQECTSTYPVCNRDKDIL